MSDLKQLSDWNHGIARAVEALGSDGFFPALVDAVGRHVTIDYPQVWLYHRELPARVIYHDVPESALERQIERQLKGGYRNDPFFETSMNQPKNKIYVLSRMGGDRLKASDSYNSYFSGSGTVDQAVFMTLLQDGSVLNLSMLRLKEHGVFTEEDYQLLYSLADPVVGLLKAHSEHTPFAVHQLIQPGINHQIDLAFRTFGESLLSPREKDVLELMLRGYGTDTSATRLCIARETVRRHRKSIYHKLDVNSQTDLFSLFINAMSCLGEAAGADPLSVYMSPG